MKEKTEAKAQVIFFKEQIETLYMEKLRKLGFSKKETSFCIKEYEEETRITFSDKIFPEKLKEKIPNANATKKYRISFNPLPPDKVEVVIHGQPLFIFGSSMIMYILFQAIFMHEGREMPKRTRKDPSKK